MDLILITNDCELAKYAETSGVDIIMVDLEIIGKKERQGHLDTVISGHVLEDVIRIKNVLTQAKLLVRINPIHDNSENEIESIISIGVDYIMLPMFKSVEEVEQFISVVNGRAKTMLLLETAQAMARIDRILNVEGIDSIHIGLNDLHLALQLDFMFELLSGGIVEYISKKIRAKKIPFGFGGIARIGHGLLDASLILSEHYRLNSAFVILSRNFHSNSKNIHELTSLIDLKQEVLKIRKSLKQLEISSKNDLISNKNLLIKKVQLILNTMRLKTE